MDMQYISSNTYMANSLYRYSNSIGIAIDNRPNSSISLLYKERDTMKRILSAIAIPLIGAIAICCLGIIAIVLDCIFGLGLSK